jgi:hypothetical protein
MRVRLCSYVHPHGLQCHSAASSSGLCPHHQRRIERHDSNDPVIADQRATEKKSAKAARASRKRVATQASTHKTDSERDRDSRQMGWLIRASREKADAKRTQFEPERVGLCNAPLHASRGHGKRCANRAGECRFHDPAVADERRRRSTEFAWALLVGLLLTT